jgi:hypothetical protein
MRNGSNLLEPEPRPKGREEGTTRVFWKPSLPEAAKPRPIADPRFVPYLLAPPPWPRGQFRIDPEV